MQDVGDDELMRLSGLGDRDAFRRLVERYAKRAGGMAGRMTGNRSDAEEIVQEALLRTWLKAPDWRTEAESGAKFATWFYRVVVNLAIDRRRKPMASPLDVASEIADPAPSAFDRTSQAETARKVAVAVAALPDRQRVALTLCHYQGMTNIEAAAVLELSIGALESLLVRARRTLRVTLAELAPAGGGEA